jgi:hypothetical protein
VRPTCRRPGPPLLQRARPGATAPGACRWTGPSLGRVTCCTRLGPPAPPPRGAPSTGPPLSFLSAPPPPFSECRHAPRPLSFPFARRHPRPARSCPLPPLGLSFAPMAGPPLPLAEFRRNHSRHHRLPWPTVPNLLHSCQEGHRRPPKAVGAARAVDGHRRERLIERTPPRCQVSLPRRRQLRTVSPATHHLARRVAPCHRGARREDPPPVRSSVRRCAPRRWGHAG